MTTEPESIAAKRAHVAIVMRMAAAGIAFHPKKMEWVQTVGARLGIEVDTEEVRKLDADTIRSTVARSRSERAVIIRDALLCGSADGHVDQDEYSTLFMIADWLDFSDDDLRRIRDIGSASRSAGSDSDLEAIRDAFKQDEAVTAARTVSCDDVLLCVCKHNTLTVSGLWKLLPKGAEFTEEWWMDLWLFGGWVDPENPIERIGIVQANSDPEAIARARVVVVKHLMSQGANPRVPDEAGLTAIDYAKRDPMMYQEAINCLLGEE